MNNRSFPSIALLLAALPIAPLEAQRGKACRAPQSTSQLRVAGHANQTNTKRVLDQLTWHRTMASATRSAKRKGRLIVVIQALGNIRGLC